MQSYGLHVEKKSFPWFKCCILKIRFTAVFGFPRHIDLCQYSLTLDYIISALVRLLIVSVYSVKCVALLNTLASDVLLN